MAHTGGKSFVQGFWHRIVGARGALLTTGVSHGDASGGHSAPTNSRYSFPDPLLHNQVASTTTWGQGNFGKMPIDPIQEIAQHKVVFFGEVHSMPPIIALQRDIQAAMLATAEDPTPPLPYPAPKQTNANSGGHVGIPQPHRTAATGTLHVILEHFSFELQGLLDQYMANEIDFDTLIERYHAKGEEHHDLLPYRELLEDAKTAALGDEDKQQRRGTRQIRLHAGFLPRRYARMLLKEGEEVTLQSIASQWLTQPPASSVNAATTTTMEPRRWSLQGSERHYNIFESLLTGRSLYSQTDTSEQPTDQFRRIFPAQVLKDEAMAYKVTQLLQGTTTPDHPQSAHTDDSNKDTEQQVTTTMANAVNNDDKFLIIAGNGHVLHYTGVPERVIRDNPQLSREDMCLVISQSISTRDAFPIVRAHTKRNTDRGNDISQTNEDDQTLKSWMQRQFGQEGSDPADYVFFYEIPQDVLDEWSTTEVKQETLKAYNKVGETATVPGNVLKAAWVMHHLGYSEQDFDLAGPDAYNFQGVGNPHAHAHIQEGEIVLDVGSGLGIDSIIASYAVGPNGHVIGIDLSEREIRHTQKRFQERGLTNASFVVGDMEDMTSKIPDNSIDVIISNGAFCLAPNKEKAFAELYRVLKPGGRISICTTTIQENKLEPGVSWPLCMKMFVAKDTLQPLCEQLGFCDVVVDDSNSSMSMEIPAEVFEQRNSPERGDRHRIHVGAETFRHLEDFDMDRICARVCVVAKKPILPG